MPIYDSDGSANREIGRVYDHNGSVNTQIGKVYDSNGSANSLIYQFATEKTQVIYDTSAHTGWWANFGTGIANGLYRHYTGSGEYFSPWIDLTNYTKVTIHLFVRLSNGGSVGLNFGFCPQSDPINYHWNQGVGVKGYDTWQGPDLKGTYDISSLTGIWRIKQQTYNGPDTANTYLGNSNFTYLDFS